MNQISATRSGRQQRSVVVAIVFFMSGHELIPGPRTVNAAILNACSHHHESEFHSRRDCRPQARYSHCHRIPNLRQRPRFYQIRCDTIRFESWQENRIHLSQNITVRPRNDLDILRSAFECQLLEIQSGKNKLFLCNIH